jgi:NADPH-dependent 2,4-dienoyl-CoA reductase/sulfur reductase-like enzyme
MKKTDVVIIGGSAAGIPAAITCRRHNPEKNILVIRKEKKVLIPCSIPYIFGTLRSTEHILISDEVLEKNGIELLIDEAKKIKRVEKTIILASGEMVSYDKLILATGSLPMDLPIPGIKKKNVFTIEKNAEYLNSLLSAVNNAKDLIIIGCGFIGVEFADECKKDRDINIKIVEMLHQCLILVFEEDFAIESEKILNDKEVEILPNEKVVAILGTEEVKGVRLSSGRELKADAVIVGVGVQPNIQLAKDSGLEIGPKKAISVDRYMRTSDENIFACGDCAEKISFFTGKPTPLMLASIATMEARIAGSNVYGARRENSGAIGVFSTVTGNIALAAAGFTEKSAKEYGYNVAVGQAESPDRHPGKMPGMKKMMVKLVFNKNNGVILGGHVLGGTSTGELINAISACIQKRLTADEISMFQTGTHPALTASPISYPLVNAAEMAIKAMK